MDLELTIVTITYRDPGGLRRTLESLRPLTNLVKFEHLIVNGSPEESGSGEIMLSDFPWTIDMIHEPPTGIYSAMNAGVKRARGVVVWFLNSGDQLGEAEAVKMAVGEIVSGEIDIVCGDARIFRAGKLQYGYRAPLDLWRGLRGENRFCHQAVFYSRKFFFQVGEYSDSFAFAGDYDHLMRCWGVGAQYRMLDAEVVQYDRSGVSDRHYRSVFREFRKIQERCLRGKNIFIRMQCGALFYLGYLRVVLFKRLVSSPLGFLLRPIWMGWKRL